MLIIPNFVSDDNCIKIMKCASTFEKAHRVTCTHPVSSLSFQNPKIAITQNYCRKCQERFIVVVYK